MYINNKGHFVPFLLDKIGFSRGKSANITVDRQIHIFTYT